MPRGSSYRRGFRISRGGARTTAQEMDDELEAHVQMRAEDLVRQGMTPDAARREAERRFGDFDTARLRLRRGARQREQAMQLRDALTSIVGDVKFAWRLARRAPAFTLLAVSTLALGIGLTTATFTLVNGVLLRPLPFDQSERLVALQSVDSLHHIVPVVSSGNWLDWKAESKALEHSAIYFDRRMSITDDLGAQRAAGQVTSGDFFGTLKTRFLVGRPFTEAEGQEGAPVVVISEGLWKRVMGADPTLARPLRLDGRPATVVGVVAAGYEYPAGTELWAPMPFRPEGGGMRNNVNWAAIGRLRPGVTIDQARRDLDAIAIGIHRRDPVALYSFGVDVQLLRDVLVQDVARYLQMLMGAVALVLLIACSNFAAATLGRGAVRAREMAVRAAIGAGRARLVQQLLIEHVLIALTGGVVGLTLAWLATRSLLRTWGAEIPRAEEIHIDGRVIVFVVGVSLLAGVVSGIVPALRGSHTSLRGLISSAGRNATRGGRRLPGAALVIGEIALALVLLTASGLVIRSFRSLVSRDLGFDTNVVTAEATLVSQTYADVGRRMVYWDAVESSLKSVPGVTAVGLANWIPLGIGGAGFIEIADHEYPNAGAAYRVVSPGYFRAIGIPLVAGRVFGDADGATTERVVVVNRAMAEKYWPGESPLGKRVRASSQEFQRGGGPAPWLTVVGVVGNVRHWGFDADAAPEMYVLLAQVPGWTSDLTAIVRGTIPPERLVPVVRARMHAVDPLVATVVGTLGTRLDQTLANRRLTMSLLTAFGSLALVLAAIGLYGMLSYAVAQRTRELALRSALGARSSQLMALVLGDAMRAVAIGAAIGLAGAFALSRAMSSMLIDVSPADPLSYAVATTVLVLVALVAVIVPARRAMRLDPMIALQAE